MTSAMRLTAVLDEHDVPYEMIPHRRTLSAIAEGKALGVDSGHVAKTLVLDTGDGFVRAVLPASERIDLDKVRSILDLDRVALAPEEQLVVAYPEFELGAVPPLGGPAGDPVVVDRRLQTAGSVVFEAGTHDESVRMTAADLIEAAGARVADICAE